MSRVRGWVRRAVPLSWRQAVAHTLRRWRDFRHGIHLPEIRRDIDSSGFALQVEISQPVMAGALFENKLLNLMLGAKRVNRSWIAPGKTWSFWRHVRKPSQGNGYVPGRNLVSGQLQRQIGGGLCQLSSLIYHLGLQAGLTVSERHAHSIDIYREHERFTPLGSDATVVWGHKDLRLINPHDSDVVLECFLHGHTLTGRVFARGPLHANRVDFRREQLEGDHVAVHTLVNEVPHTRTVYVQRQGLGLQA